MERVSRIFFAGLAVLCGLAQASGQVTNHLTLEALRQVRLPDVVLESVTPAHSGNLHVAAVKVDGVIGGSIRFELLLPEAWNGRFVMGGGGGFVGSVQNQEEGAVNRGYATVGTDTEPSERFSAVH